MKKLYIAIFAILCAINGIEYLHTAPAITAKDKREKRNKHRAQAAANSAKLTAAQANLAQLKGQPLIDALVQDNMQLTASITKHQKNIQIINSHRGKHAVIVHGKSKMRLNAPSQAQRSELKNNMKKITQYKQQMINNNMLIANTKQSLSQISTAQAQKDLLALLQQGTGQISPALQATLNTLQEAYYNQGKADQLNADEQSMQSAYNQGYSDGQTGVDSSQDSTADTAAYNSICDDNTNATCADGTNLALTTCSIDGQAPDINGMCSDGSFVICNDGVNYPLCDDGLPSM